MLQFKSLLPLGLFLLLGSGIHPVAAGEAADPAHSSGSCERAAEPQATSSASAVEVPDYAADSADRPDPREQAQQAVWKDYQQSLFDALSRSAHPRDWALATLLHRVEFYLDPKGAEATASTALLERAVRAAPDDALVQWIAARAPHAGSTTPALATAAAQRLVRLEPNNAAVLLDDLAAATRRKDSPAIDAILARMSTRSAFDEHVVDVMKIALDAYRRNPVPEDYWRFAAPEEEKSPREAIAFTGALAVAVAAGIPAYQHLVEACRNNEASAKPRNRAADCAAIGHLMIAHGGTLVANRIGYTLLRISLTYSDDDVAAARRDDWLYAKDTGSINADGVDETAASIAAYEQDWIETGNEIETIRRKLTRAHIPTEPPADWTNEHGMFSAQRLQADAQRVEQRAARANK